MYIISLSLVPDIKLTYSSYVSPKGKPRKSFSLILYRFKLVIASSWLCQVNSEKYYSSFLQKPVSFVI